MTVPFSDRLCIEFHGNVSCNTICLGDLNNDGCHELCVGNSMGQLSIFKDFSTDPWLRKEKLGHIVALTCGDLFNQGRNVLLVITAEGLCRVFDFQGEHMEESDMKNQSLFNPCFMQRLPPNVKQAQIGDVNGDGLNELIVTLTDRVVRTYLWRQTKDRYQGGKGIHTHTSYLPSATNHSRYTLQRASW